MFNPAISLAAIISIYFVFFKNEKSNFHYRRTRRSIGLGVASWRSPSLQFAQGT